MDCLDQKKDRNQKRQRDKFHKKKPGVNSDQRKPDELKSNDQVTSNNGGLEPQPQRANRRNEQIQSNIVSSPSTGTQGNKEVENTNVVDHSHLKRETEEIEKLTKKFTKREISSNWHRYSVSESKDNEDLGQDLADSAPADFFDLLRMPTSRGGHLQLKEEQNWATASGNELSSYFALDLKLLNQSLSCIPMYEQLRLPKHIFNDEEIKRFDEVANQAKKCYNKNSIFRPDKVEVSDEHTPKAKEVPKAVKGVQGQNQKSVQITENNVAHVTSKNETASAKLNEALLTRETLVEEENTNSKDSPILRDEEVSPVYRQETKTGSEFLNLLNNTNNSPLPEISLEIGKKDDKEHNECNLLSYVISQTLTSDNKGVFCSKDSCLPIDNGGELKVSKPIVSTKENDSTSSQSKPLSSSPSNKISYPSEIDKYGRNNEHSVHKNNQETAVEENKIGNKLKELNLEDDDELDFLLTLKNPVPSQKPKETKPLAPIKDSSFLPSGTSLQHAASNEHSELDDWLDSVLED